MVVAGLWSTSTTTPQTSKQAILANKAMYPTLATLFLTVRNSVMHTLMPLESTQTLELVIESPQMTSATVISLHQIAPTNIQPMARLNADGTLQITPPPPVQTTPNALTGAGAQEDLMLGTNAMAEDTPMSSTPTEVIQKQVESPPTLAETV